MSLRGTSLNNNTTVAITKEIASKYDTVKTVADSIEAVEAVGADIVKGISNPVDVANDSLIEIVANDLGNINTVSDSIVNIDTLADNLNSLESSITIVGEDLVLGTAVYAGETNTIIGNYSYIELVAKTAGEIAIVADFTNLLAILTVEAIVEDIIILANIDTQVSAIADINTEILSLYSIQQEIVSVDSLRDSIVTIASISTKIDSLFADKIALDSIYSDKATLDSLYADKVTLDSLYTDKAAIDSLYADKAVLDSLYADRVVLLNVFAEKNDIDIVSFGINAGWVGNVSDNMDGTVSTAIIDVAAELDSINNYYDTYQGGLSVAPVLRKDGTALEVGDLYFDSTLDELRVYNGSVWKSAGSTVNGTATRQTFTATAGQTVFNITGGYDAGYADVYLQGIKLNNGDDVDVTSGTDVILADGAIAGQILDVVAYGAFEIANHYTKSESDTLHRAVPMKVKANEVITKGDVVTPVGYNQGQDSIEVILTTDQTSVSVGIANVDISNGNSGDIITRGLIEGIDTSAFNFGDIVYSAGAGGMTNVKPPGVYQAIGYIVKDHAINGAMMVDFTEPKNSENLLLHTVGNGGGNPEGYTAGEVDIMNSSTTHNITSDADYTLTSNQNKYGRIILTDDGIILTSAINVIVNDSEKDFYFQNDTLQDVTVKTLSGTGVLVQTLSSLLLLTDGVNVIEPAPPLVDTRLNNADELYAGQVQDEEILKINGDIIKSQCTAWASFSLSAVTIADELNIESIILVSAGRARLTFKANMANLNYSVCTTGDDTGVRLNTFSHIIEKNIAYVEIGFKNDQSSNINVDNGNIIILGGK